MSDLSDLTGEAIGKLGDFEFEALLNQVVGLAEDDRKVNQIQYYKPITERHMRMHSSDCHIIGAGGGNGSGKSEACLVELVMCATGVFPDSCKHLSEKKFRGPINTRIVVESLTTVMHPIMLPKLKWNQWTGMAPIGGSQGHWGWVPRDCLIDGDWKKSWSEKLRTLTVLCRDPNDREKVLGHSKIQFMSHDNDPEDFASGDYHIVMLDEPPTYPIFTENQARTMRVNGKIILAMTWPDDPAIPVDWIYDEIYDKAASDPDIDWFELYTTDNPHLDQDAIAKQMDKWDEEMKRVRILGQPIRFSNLIHPGFTDHEEVWSFKAGKNVLPMEGWICPITGSDDLETYCHVQEFDISPSWPVVWLLDPHPRKPHMFMWVAIDPNDDCWVVADGEFEGQTENMREYINEIERQYGIHASLRLVDPNMGRSPAGQTRGDTWQEEFARCGIYVELADDSSVGRSWVNGMLKPDPHLRKPRLHIHKRCENTIYQLKRYSWGEYKKNQERDVKQTPREKFDDYPTMLKYLGNYRPDFNMLKNGAPIIGAGRRSGAYGS
jgi:hypothetical protein